MSQPTVRQRALTPIDQPTVCQRALTPIGQPAVRQRALTPIDQPTLRQRAFTLIELMVVLAIIGLLLTIQLPRYFHSIDRGKVQVQQQNLSVMRNAIDQFYGDNDAYPQTLDELVTRHYLRSMPVDPVSGSSNWRTIASPDATRPGIYDVAPPGSAPEAPAAAAAGGQ
jgi:general secretion pathway protein G